MIEYNKPTVVGTEQKYIADALNSGKLSGDGKFATDCALWIQKRIGARKVLLTNSCTSALEISAILCGLSYGDEVILPSFTHPSSAAAFVRTGAVPVFVDIRPDTMNIDEGKIEAAVTDRTKSICVVHYAGVSCEMDKIMGIAQKYGLFVVEDAAQGFMGKYKGRPLGTIGDFGCYSFHDSKNYTMGEGGALVVNKEDCALDAEILRDCGTNRASYLRGEVEKYHWVGCGGSYLPSELNAACLWAQLEAADEILANRLDTWKMYYNELVPLQDAGVLELPVVPEGCLHNGHIFYIKLKTRGERVRFTAHMNDSGIGCPFHYVPLHSAPAGLKLGRFHGRDEYTTADSERLVRLPIYYKILHRNIETVVSHVRLFYENAVK